MEVTGAAERPSARGPAEWFTGEVWMDEIASLPGPGPVRALRVHFTPGARTAWHAHPLGQVLHIVEGVGRVQSESGPVRQVRPGDTVVAGPGEKALARRGPRPPDVPPRDRGGGDRLARARHRRGLPGNARPLVTAAAGSTPALRQPVRPGGRHDRPPAGHPVLDTES